MNDVKIWAVTKWRWNEKAEQGLLAAQVTWASLGPISLVLIRDKNHPSKRSSGEYRCRRTGHAKEVRFNFLRKTSGEIKDARVRGRTGDEKSFSWPTCLWTILFLNNFIVSSSHQVGFRLSQTKVVCGISCMRVSIGRRIRHFYWWTSDTKNNVRLWSSRNRWSVGIRDGSVSVF